MPSGTGSRAALAVALALAAGAARAQDVVIDAAVDRAEVPLGDVVTLKIRLETPELPSALEVDGEGTRFRVVSRSESRFSSASLRGGAGVRIEHVVTWRLGIAPLREGAVALGPATVVVGGKRHASKPVSLNVLPPGAAPRAPSPGLVAPGAPPSGAPRTWRGWERDLAYVAEVDRSEVWLGQGVTVSFWLLSPVDAVSTQEMVPPVFDGFWAEDVELADRLEYRVREVNGIPVRAYLLRRTALFPARAGTLTIPPVELAVGVRLGTGSPFDPFPEIRQARRRTRPVTISVKPLPPGAPADFQSVNVGTFSLSLETDRNDTKVGEPVTVRLIASGEGNVRAIALPRLPPIPGAHAFDPVAKDHVLTDDGPMRGERVLETVVVPDRAGELAIPPLEWATFDPRTGRYERARTAARRIAVAPAAVAAASGAADRRDAGLRPLRADLSLSRRGAAPWATPLFALAIAAPPLAFLGLALGERVRERRRAGERSRRERSAGRAARRRLARARRLLGTSPNAFFAGVEHALLGYAADRLGRPTTGLTREALARALGDAGAHPLATRALTQALDVLDAARFGGGAAPEEVLADAERALARLEDAAWTSAEGRP